MGERRGTKALELWCRRITEGYPGVNVQNMTTSWKDGLAFCAMIHHFRPDLIDFDSLDKNDVYGNNDLAFKIAEQHLGIPALLDAEDMASCSVPDRLSILTYLSQFYQTFGGSSPSRLAVNRTTESTEEKITPIPESPNEKAALGLGMRRDPCAVCGLPVFLAEKLVLGRVAYHRTCFRCARCNNQLTLGNYYETEKGQYCCETCPDEEPPSPTMQNYTMPNRNEVDGVEDASSNGSYSNEDNANAQTFDDSLKQSELDDFSVPDIIAQTSRLRLNFISNHLLSDQDTADNVDSMLPMNDQQGKESRSSTPRRNEDHCSFDGEGSSNDFHSAQLEPSSRNQRFSDDEDSNTNCSTNFTHQEEPSTSKTNIEEQLTDKTVKSDSTNCLSLVQARLRLFENPKDSFEKSNEVPKCKAQYKKHNVKKEDSKDSEIVSKVSTTPVNDTLMTTPEINEMIVLESDKMIHSQINSEKHISTIDVSETDSTTKSSIVAEKDYPESLNPFKSDEEENTDTDSIINISESNRSSTNPFENKEEKKKELVIPKPAVRSNIDNNIVKSQTLEEVSTKRRLIAPQINLNPFWSDDDEQESDSENKIKVPETKPVPKPRTTRNIQEPEVNGSKSDQNYNSLNVSNSSLASLESPSSLGTTCRKKKPAPLPPNKKERSPDQHMPQTSSPIVLTKARKTKPAPPPPMQTSSPCNTSTATVLSCEESPISKSKNATERINVWEDEKISKDVANRNRQSFSHTPSKEGFYDRSFMDKSTEGKWKRKKGPAPPCPMPLKRKIKVMSLKDVKLELDEIEVQQQGLEKQGVRLEQLIRSKCESDSKPDDVSLGTDVEELVLELFALVNEKNELFRRQAELMLLRRQQRLEEEHAEVEYQIRCLMSQQESMKTDFDKQREEALIKRLVEIVERRNEIVDCLEMDRRREIEEDKSIHKHMDLFAVKNKNEILNRDSGHSRKTKAKENKSKDKTKEKKFKKILKKDIDKDIDEIELKLKRHNKRKWF
ncbi:MICAL-like protein isoform X2 [Osmia lignaria lignaria]|uniref:MICAL-like protein isoform X2 n=1 Tax=Osmia lignaria lignaria TaxID=1437193 RepID=UPI00402B7B57